MVEKSTNKKTINTKTNTRKTNTKISIKKNTSNSLENNVSVITKTTKPQVIIQSEKIEKNVDKYIWTNKHKLIKFCCMIILCIIILITFFLTLKVYNMLSDIHNIII